MQIVLFLILIFCTFSSGLAAAYFGFYGNPDHPGKCVLNGLILSLGDIHYDATRCEMTICREKSWASFFSCGIYQPPDHCKLGDPIHPTAPYPDCCPRHEICNTIEGKIQ